MLESLEGRTHFSAVTWSVHKGVLKIIGTPGRDRINLNGRSGALVLTLDGQAQTVQSHVSRVDIYADAGNDMVDGTRTRFAYYVEGGAGNDTIYSGSGHDTLFGGRGNDFLADYQYLQLDDYQDGGPGDDHLMDGGTMNGGSGHDVGEVTGADGQFTSGLEEFYDDDDAGAIYNRSDSQGMLSLSTHKGRLRINTTINFDGTVVSGPFLRADGKVGLLAHTYDDDAVHADHVQTLTFNPRYTKLGLGRGIVLSYDDGSEDRPVLLTMA